MDELTAFVRARLDEDEAAAMAAAHFGEGKSFSGRPQWVNQYGMVVDASDSDWAIADLSGTAVSGEPVYVHIARHDPARVLREVAAKGRRVVGYIAACDAAQKHGDAYMRGLAGGLLLAVKDDAAVWSDHPDYRAEWAV